MPVSSVYVGNFSDVNAAKEAAVNMIAHGADFVIPDADAAGIGVIQAAREAGPDVATFGVFTDITSTAPDNILGTYLADYAKESPESSLASRTVRPCRRAMSVWPQGRRRNEVHL